ncbi:MAG: DUF1576 domain-containing protein [Candidatus Binatia bacterium]
MQLICKPNGSTDPHRWTISLLVTRYGDTCAGGLHGGLNLYNSGFVFGIVVAILLPIIETFRHVGVNKVGVVKKGKDYDQK